MIKTKAQFAVRGQAGVCGRVSPLEPWLPIIGLQTPRTRRASPRSVPRRTAANPLDASSASILEPLLRPTIGMQEQRCALSVSPPPPPATVNLDIGLVADPGEAQ